MSLLTLLGREARFLMMGKRGKGARLRPDFQPRDLPRGFGEQAGEPILTKRVAKP